MKIVLDANIYVSAYLRGGVPFFITDRVEESLDTSFFTCDTIEEIEDVISRSKFGLSQEQIDCILADIRYNGKQVAVLPQQRVFDVCRDPKDDKILECAVVAGADYIVSGDNDLLDMKEYRGIKIVTASEYLQIVDYTKTFE